VRIEWNKPGERFYEAGVSNGVFYPKVGPGVPWNGLVSVNENASGGEVESLYFNGVKYLDIIAAEDFSATLEAYAAPREFAACDGTRALSPGLFVTQQPRKTFGLCYRTLIGNDLEGTDFGYKLHIVYGITASPSPRNNQTLAGNSSPNTRTWTLNTVPPKATTFRPTAHIVIDSTLVEAGQMQQLEGILYGHAGADPYLPTVGEIVNTLDSRISEFITEFI
jgi:hypothetical protein